MLAATQTPPLLSHVNVNEFSVSLPELKIISYLGPGASGGVAKILEPLVKQLGTRVHWIALSHVPAPSDNGASFCYYKPAISDALIEKHKHFCLTYLWPLLHGMPELAVFDYDGWKGFKQLNEAVALHCEAISAESFPTVSWTHDFQMALLAPALADEAGTIPCHFWHVPWPKPEVIAKTPIAHELVTGMLSNQLIGFHTNEYALNFLNTVQDVVPEATVDLLTMSVRYNDETVRVVVMPLGLDFAYWQQLAKENRPRAAAMPKKYRLANQVLLGVDRLDFNKGVLAKLNGLDNFLRHNTQWHRRFHYVQLWQKPLSMTSAFIDYAEEVEMKWRSINATYGSADWEPIVWLEAQADHQELAAWYLAADVLLVTPERDGLNLIAKEYVACRADEQGSLILSRQTGSAAELSTGALLVDAYDEKQIAEAITQALTMSVEEKRRRMLSMRHIVGWNQLHDWALSFLKQAIACKLPEPATQAVMQMPPITLI